MVAPDDPDMVTVTEPVKVPAAGDIEGVAIWTVNADGAVLLLSDKPVFEAYATIVALVVRTNGPL